MIEPREPGVLDTQHARDMTAVGAMRSEAWNLNSPEWTMSWLVKIFSPMAAGVSAVTAGVIHWGHPGSAVFNPRETSMRVFLAAAMVIALVQPALAQQKPMQKYGDPDTEKSQQEIRDAREAEKAYSNSLKNIPDKGPTDPWGAVRSTGTPATPTKKKTGAASQ